MSELLLTNDLLSSIVAFGLVLIPAIIIHELGHFLAAKAVGITILEFGIGFPPRVAKLFRWGETEVTLNLLPIGGFVRPLGEDMIRPRGEDLVAEEREQLESRQSDPAISGKKKNTSTMAVYEARPWPRILFMAGGALANFLSAFLLFIAIALIGIPQDIGGTIQILDVAPDSAFAAAGLQPNDLIEAVNGDIVTTQAELLAKLDSLSGQPVTLTIMRGEPSETLNVTLTPSADDNLTDNKSYVRVLSVAAGSPAANSGLLADDLIIAFNSQTTDEMADPTQGFITLTNENAGKAVTLTVLRDGEERSISLVPRLDPPPEEGRMGISIWTEYRTLNDSLTYHPGPAQRDYISQPITQAIQYGVDRTVAVFGMVGEAVNRLFSGTLTAQEARPVSVIGISMWGGQVLQRSIEDNQVINILNFVALISILLGITNLLPLPALDGGRIVFVLIEIVRGRPIPPEREGLVHLIGFVIILSIGIFFMLNDLINPLPSILP